MHTYTHIFIYLYLYLYGCARTIKSEDRIIFMSKKQKRDEKCLEKEKWREREREKERKVLILKRIGIRVRV